MSNIIRKLKFPLLAIGLIAILYLIWWLFKLPSEQEIMAFLQGYFDKYGLITVLISSILEGLILIGFYYPGGTVIFFSVILAGPDPVRAATVVALVTLGLFIAYIINYFLGEYGWYRLFMKMGFKEGLETAKDRLAKRGAAAIFLTYWQPSLASLTATAAGVLRTPFNKFFIFSLISTTIWAAFWGTLAYIMGEGVFKLIGIRFLILVISLWVIYELFFTKKEETTPEQSPRA